MGTKTLAALLAVALLGMAEPAAAEVVDVPMLPDGTVDIERVLSGFTVSHALHDRYVSSTAFTGTVLGEAFSGNIIDIEPQRRFVLEIAAPTVSEHGSFIIALLVLDSACTMNGLVPDPLPWHKTAIKKHDVWTVEASCSLPQK
jgi:hypothetical protein